MAYSVTNFALSYQGKLKKMCIRDRVSPGQGAANTDVEVTVKALEQNLSFRRFGEFTITAAEGDATLTEKIALSQQPVSPGTVKWNLASPVQWSFSEEDMGNYAQDFKGGPDSPYNTVLAQSGPGYDVYKRQGQGIADVLVSDGDLITKTDANGFYWLNSEKRNELAFVILPAGYDVPTVKAMPQFWQPCTLDANTVEQLDFQLLRADNDSHTMLVATSMVWESLSALSSWKSSCSTVFASSVQGCQNWGIALTVGTS